MITISKLSKSFGARTLLSDVDLRIGARDRAAIVGPNGAGKTTLLEMICGEQRPDSGTISKPSDVTVGYLRQETDALRGRSLIEEVTSAGAEVNAAAHRLAVLEEEIAVLGRGDERDRMIAEYGRLQDRYAVLGGYTLETQAKRVLAGLGFEEEDFERPAESFSGGWMMRIALAKLLLAAPDVLLLDEPTNHLDVESVEWLERFLRGYDGAILLISHDRDFMNGLATRVVEIDGRSLISYTGNYEDFVRQRDAATRQADATARNQARRVAETERFINRFRYKASKAKQVQSRIKALERMDKNEAPGSRRKTMNLSFPTPPRAGRVVLELAGVWFSYGDDPVYESLDLVLERGDKVALVGPNGAGKSTLLKLLAGALTPDVGERKLGHNVAVGYFAQHQIEALDPGNRVLQELERAMPRSANLRPRDLLGRFLFSGDDVDKPVAVLSGGERTRLALAKLLVAPFNVLCLDEPTNHLDIWSRDVLEDALVDYEGALVLITHDRHLIRQVATKIVEVVAGNVTVFAGDYDFYLSAREPRADDPLGVPPATLEKESPRDRRRREAEDRARTKGARDRIRGIEAEIEDVTAELARLEGLFADPAFYTSDVDVATVTRDYEQEMKRLRALERRWEELSEVLEEDAPGSRGTTAAGSG